MLGKAGAKKECSLRDVSGSTMAVIDDRFSRPMIAMYFGPNSREESLTDWVVDGGLNI
jgi:hypothetical protein